TIAPKCPRPAPGALRSRASACIARRSEFPADERDRARMPKFLRIRRNLTLEMTLVSSSVQRLPVEDQRKSHHHYRERHQRPDVGPEIRPVVTLEQDAAHEAHEVSRGQDLADRLRPAGHAAEREHEARE